MLPLINRLAGFIDGHHPGSLSQPTVHKRWWFSRPVLALVTTATADIVEAEAQKLRLSVEMVAGDADTMARRFVVRAA